MPNSFIECDTRQNRKVKATKILKIRTTLFVPPTPIEKAKNMSNYDVHAKQHFLITNHVQKAKFLEVALKMSTRQPCIY